MNSNCHSQEAAQNGYRQRFVTRRLAVYGRRKRERREAARHSESRDIEARPDVKGGYRPSSRLESATEQCIISLGEEEAMMFWSLMRCSQPSSRRYLRTGAIVCLAQRLAEL
jgi:hypothetical protein